MENWKDVSKELPEKYGHYIVSYKGHLGNYVICVLFNPQYNKFADLNNEITHWMPMPNPPRI